MSADSMNRLVFQDVSGGEAVVLLRRFELPTSPLPRECSTPELQQHGHVIACALL